ncbi:MAG: biotin operon repressor, partial [Selenomonadaceae bacterium]|nr:biotin operon repressor [Selenomonadaceae bacterium]
MRMTIVEMLKSAGGDFISGESIAGKLGVSRTAVWKHIQKLRQNGYQILSSERCGYKL